MSRLRSSEWVILIYFTYVAIAAAWFFPPAKAWAVALVVGALIWILSRRRSVLRDFAPAAFTLAAYREMNWFRSANYDHHFENAWIVWDRWLLGDGGHLRALIESAGALFPSYFELCYALVYGIAPVSILVLFFAHRRDRINLFWMAYLTGTLGAYAMFPYFPSEPPWLVFANADFPHIATVFRRLNLWILGGYGIHASVFPSAHVSSAFSAAWGLLAAIPEGRWIGWTMAAYGLSVAIATVYGRYHFAADAVAGIAVSLVAAAALRLHEFFRN
ncbi:MAG TPA: phosphatase PAP2 family protein [Bryobacteraceae bacterium]|nr:phosphatase PAP2 family protein [Bryobacteraceae bacterium]